MKPIDLNEERLKRDHAAGHAAHERGEVFAFLPYEPPGPSEEDIDVGLAEHDGAHPVCLLLSREQLTGVCMSRDVARRLGRALLEVAEQEVPEAEASP